MPHFSIIECSNCKGKFRVHVLEIKGKCPNCGTISKYRGYASIGTEIQDVIDAVLEWMGEGETFAAAMARYHEINETKQ